MERRRWEKTSWSRLPCPVWERASSSGIREILPEVKAFTSAGSSCLRTLCSNSFSPQTLVQVAHFVDDRQVEYQLKTNPNPYFIENWYLSVALIRINQLTDTTTQENSMYKSLRKGRIRQLEKNTSWTGLDYLDGRVAKQYKVQQRTTHTTALPSAGRELSAPTLLDHVP